MLQAVHVIHEEKIVHSDLKPANFVLVRGQLKLIDFGIANAIANDTTNIQRDHQVRFRMALGVVALLLTRDFFWLIDRYRELHVSRNDRASRWHAAPQSRQAKRCMVARMHSLSNGLRSSAVPAPLSLPENEGDPGHRSCHRVS